MIKGAAGRGFHGVSKFYYFNISERDHLNGNIAYFTRNLRISISPKPGLDGGEGDAVVKSQKVRANVLERTILETFAKCYESGGQRFLSYRLIF